MEQQLPDGWFDANDIAAYRKLYESLPDHSITAEVGVWKGRSLCSIADIIIRKNIRVFAVDTFEGTESEGDAHKEAKQGTIYEQFVANITRFGINKNVTIVRQNSLDTADAFQDEQFALVFIDANHTAEAVRDDITAWLPVADILCGHDWAWDSVKEGIYQSGYTATEIAPNMWRLNDALLSVVIPTWQGANRVLGLLKTIKENTSEEKLRKLEIVVVNNNPETAKDYSDYYPELRIRSINEFRKGFGYACNAGAEEARGEYILFLNDDCKLLYYWENDLWLDLLLGSLYGDNVGAVGVHKLHDNVLDFDFLVGFFFAIRRGLFKRYGGFAIYEWGVGEDIELCWRLYCDRYELKNIGVTEHGEYPIYHEAEGTLHDEEHKDKWVGGLFENNLKAMYENVKDVKPLRTAYGVTAVVPTRGRYSTTLPMTLCHIACQTVLPYEVIVYDDNDETQDVREWETIGSILRMYDGLGIKWRWQFGAKAGAWVSHQRSIKEANTRYIWRVDDDCFPKNNVLETLLSHMEDGVSAVGGSVLFLGNPHNVKPKGFTNNLAFIDQLPNAQWFVINDKLEADHLYCSFMYDKDLAADLEFPELSRKSFREETILTTYLSSKGRLYIVPNAITYHAYASGGIRSGDGNDKEMYDNDQKLYEGFIKKLIGFIPKGKLVVAANGKGDAENLLEYVRQLETDVIICSVDNCVDVFEGLEVYNSVESVILGIDFSKHNLYEYMAKIGWKGSVLDAYKNLYG